MLQSQRQNSTPSQGAEKLILQRMSELSNLAVAGLTGVREPTL